MMSFNDSMVTESVGTARLSVKLHRYPRKKALELTVVLATIGIILAGFKTKNNSSNSPIHHPRLHGDGSSGIIILAQRCRVPEPL